MNITEETVSILSRRLNGDGRDLLHDLVVITQSVVNRSDARSLSFTQKPELTSVDTEQHVHQMLAAAGALLEWRQSIIIRCTKHPQFEHHQLPWTEPDATRDHLRPATRIVYTQQAPARISCPMAYSQPQGEGPEQHLPQNCASVTSMNPLPEASYQLALNPKP